MENNIEIFIIIMAILQIIVLIVFFIMAGNIAKIKNDITMNTKKYIEMGDMEEYAGNKAKAKEYYLKAKYCMDVLKDTSNLNADNKPYPGMSRIDLDDKINHLNNQ